MLKSLYSVIVVFIAFAAAAQETPVITPQNNNTMNNSNFELEETTIEQLDTVAVEKKKQDAQPPKTRSKKYLKKEPTRSINAAPASNTEKAIPDSYGAGASTEGVQLEDASTVQSAAYQQANYKFTVTQNQASHQPMQRSPLPEHQQEMDKAVGYFEANAPNSFEFHYFKYTSGNYDVTQVDHLRRAEKLMPDNSDVHAQMAAFNIITRDTDSANMYVEKLVSSGRLNANTLLYAEDLLISVPQNGVLITHGFDDTYSTWKKQQADGVRTDVTLISLDFLQSEFYRMLLIEDGFTLPDQKIINVDYLKKFCALNASKPISISMTAPKEYFLPIKEKLYVTGLVFEYHSASFNNFERNNTLWNSDLSKHLIGEAQDEKSKQLSANYLPMLLQLRKVYRQKGESKKVKEIDKAIDTVSLQCRKYEQVQKLKSSY